MLKKSFIRCLFFTCLIAQAKALDDQASYINYIKNKGQWNDKVLYQADFKGGRLFLEHNAFTYLFYPQDGFTQLHPHPGGNPSTQRAANKHGEDAVTLNFHTVRMEFMGSSPNANTEQLSIKPFYHNYYRGKDAKRWVNNVPISEGVNYNELYNGISLKTFSSANNVRYDFTINPSADASLIKMKFTGQNKLSIREGKLIIGTSVGDIAQQAPYAFQLIDGKEQQVSCRYMLLDDIVGIEVTGVYNHNQALIIDPTLVFATFTGSVADNWGMSATYDNQGNGYTSGICFGVGYPTTTGAFQTAWAGGGTGGGNTNWPAPDNNGFDIVVTKFDPTGSTLIFSTYLGGSDNEEPESIIVDNNNNLLVLGRSYSTDFPVTAGAYDVSQNGGADIIVAKFNSSGTALMGATFVGGSADDAVNYSSIESTLGSLKYNYADDGRGDIIIDNGNNIYVASCTQSTNFPVTTGCAQHVNKGMQDGCVFKLNTTLSTLVWSTYLGGTANDAAYNLAIDNGNSVYVTGGTESPDFPTTSGVLHTTYGGSIDGFLTHIAANGNSLAQSTYIGTSGYDQSYFVQLDNLSHVYIYGQTSGAYPITTGVYSNGNSGQFIHEFTPNLSSTLFSTEFGTGKGTPDIAPSAFLVDKCNNIYISGWGGSLFGYNNTNSSTVGMPLTSNAFQATTDGSDFYFMVLQPNASSLWYATFFGGPESQEHVDGGTSRFDKTGVIYQAICEGCGQLSDMPTTPNSWSTTNNSQNCNNALVKFSFNLIQTVAALSINPTSASGCAPFNVSFTNQSQNATHFLWNFGDGNSTTTTNAVHTYTTQGTYTVSLIAKDTLTCNLVDTIYAIITVNPPPVIAVNSPTICAGSAVNLTASGAATYTWSTGATTATINQTPNATTQYTVSATSASSCTNTAITSIVVNPLPTVSVSSATICSGNPATLTASGASSYTWNTGALTPSITHSPSTTTQYTVTGANTYSCTSKATGTITVNPSPVISISSPGICIGNTATLTASGALSYTWNTGSNTATITPTPTISTTYTVSGINAVGCVSTKTANIAVHALPLVTVNSSTICAGTSAILLASGASTYVWSTGTGGSVLTIAPMADTSYTVIGTDVNHCKDTATSNVTVNASPIISVSNASVCIGSTATLTASGAPTYTWSTGATTASITATPTAVTNYTVSSSNGICTSSKIATVTILINHTHLLSGGTIGMCTGDSVKLQTTTTYPSYSWSTGQTTPTIEATHAGTYIVQTIDNNGCKGIDSVKVHEDSKVAIPLYDTTLCSGDSAHLQVTQGNYIYLWSPSTGLNNNTIYDPTAGPLHTTTYTVSVTNGGCVNTNTVTIVVNPLPLISVKPDYTVVMQGENVAFQVQASSTCYWYPSTWLSCSTCNTSTSTPYEDITYTITTTNNYGCSASTKAKIKIDFESTFYIPNTFTPNSDGRNETFKPAYTNIHNFKMNIFDRWGLLLFQTDNPDNGWDGIYKGKLCQQDVYVYKLEYRDDMTDSYHSLSGTVNIVR